MSLRSLAATVVALLLASSALAVIVPTAQTRAVSGTASATDMSGTGSDSDSVSAPSFAAFDEARSASVSLPDAIGTGGGEQNSLIGLSSITASGSSFATAESFAFDSEAGGSGDASLDVDFTLTTDSSYTLQGSIAGFDSGSTTLALETGGGSTIFSDFGSGGFVPVDDSGTLLAGDYRLVISSGGSTFADFFTSDFASTEYDIAFQVTPLATVPAMDGFGVAATALLLAGSGCVRGRRLGRIAAA